MLAIFVMSKNSDLAFVGRCDKPHFCFIHDTAQFLFEKYTEYVDKYY
jgi:hypothetical protein